MLLRGQIPPIGAPVVRVITGHAKGFQQRLEGPEDVVRPVAQHVGSHLPGVVIDGMPKPSGCLFVTDAAPHLVELCLNSHWPSLLHLLRGEGVEQLLVDLWETCGLFLSV
jgi:hypothetical protein